jgi:ribosomal protein S18 acetylase RimI-like enzyme
MMEGFCAAVAATGATGVHFGVNPANEPALGFYRHLGFEQLRVDGATVTMGRRLA